MKKALKGLGMGLVYLLLYLALQVGVSVAGMVLIALWQLLRSGDPLAFAEGLMQSQESILSGAAGLVLAANVLFLLLIWLIFRCQKKQLHREVRLASIRPGNLIACLLVGLSMPFVLSALMSLLPFPEAVLEEFGQQQGMLFEGPAVVGFLAIVVGAPLAEEVLFRGLLYNSFKSGMRPWLAGILSALLFGLCHGQSYWILAAFLMGLLMAWCYERTGSLWGSLAIHSVNNAMAFLEQYLPQPGEVFTLVLILGLHVVLLCALVYLFLANRKTSLES